MGRGAHAVVTTPARPGVLSRFNPFQRDLSRSPLYHSPDGVSVGASLRTGFLRNLRGAPSQDRNAVISDPCHDIAMMSVYAGHGKHGSYLAELAATVVSRHVRRQLPQKPYPNGELDYSLEKIVDDAFVEANIAIDATPWSRNSGVTATVCLLRKRHLVVATCGKPCVMVASKRGGVTSLQLLSDVHRLEDEEEKERVERFGGLVKGTSVSDEDGHYTLSFTRSMGDLEMRSSGICQIPGIRTYNITSKDTHIILSTQPLWEDSEFAPQQFNDALAKYGDGCMVDLAEVLMQVAVGKTNPLCDATILCSKLR